MFLSLSLLINVMREIVATTDIISDIEFELYTLLGHYHAVTHVIPVQETAEFPLHPMEVLEEVHTL
jgi:hypothetical protein